MTDGQACACCHCSVPLNGLWMLIPGCEARVAILVCQCPVRHLLANIAGLITEADRKITATVKSQKEKLLQLLKAHISFQI